MYYILMIAISMIISPWLMIWAKRRFLHRVPLRYVVRDTIKRKSVIQSLWTTYLSDGLSIGQEAYERNNALGLTLGLIAVNIMAYEQFGLSLQLLWALLIHMVLFLVWYVDIHKRIIPNTFNSAFFVLGLIYVFTWPINWVEHVIGGLVGFILLFSLALIGDAFGGGDIKFATIMGFILGAGLSLIGFLATFTLGSLVALYQVFILKKSKKDYMAYGPYMILGFILALYFGKDLLQYLL